MSKNVIYQHLSEAYPKVEGYRDILSLDLSPNEFNLIDLEELDKDFDYRKIYSSINHIDLTRNSLSLLKLKGFNLLETVIAKENFINKVELNLTKLKKLDLSNNMINKLFELNSVVYLEELKLNKNLIERISWEDIKPVKNTLQIFEISSNKLMFNSVREFFDFFEVFGRSMKKLKTLNVSGNIFSSSKIYKDYSLLIIHYCSNLKLLNNKAIDQFTPDDSNNYHIDKIKKRIIDNEKLAGSAMIKDSDDMMMIGEEFSDVSLGDINSELEKYNNIGKFNQTSIQQLISLIESYIRSGNYNNEKNEEDNENELEDPEINLFENFLEYTDLLINSNSSLEKPFSELIAKFSYIKNGKFCSLCMGYLKNKISPEKARDYEVILKSTILNYINKTKDDQIYNNIISGCEKFAQDSKFIKIISVILPRIITLIINKKGIKFTGSMGDLKKQKEILYEALSFTTVCIRETTNIKEVLGNNEFIETVCVLIKNILGVDENILHSDYILMRILNELLKIATKICLATEANGNKFYMENVMKIVGSGLKDKFQQNLNTKFQEKKKKNDIEKKEIIIVKMEILSNIIRAYGGLLMRSKDIIKIACDPNSVSSKIMNMLVQNSTFDPLLISSACDFTYCVFEHPDMINNKDSAFEKVSNKIFSLRYIIKFIGFGNEEFNNACFIAESYGEITIARGKPVTFRQLNSKVMHSMFISIINLIFFFQKNSYQNNPINSFCFSVCEDLNEQDRDSYICEALSIPSDNVKLSIVKCLFWVDSSQLSTEEIQKVYNQMKNLSLNGGVIEEVLAITYIFLAKTFNEIITYNPEKVIASKEAFIMCIDYLVKNIEICTTCPKHELPVKNNLSLALITFLINMSCFPQIKKIFHEKAKSILLEKVLKLENNNVIQGGVPLEIEKCKTGWYTENLFGLFRGEKSINPYSYSTLRLFMHMADLLLNIPTKSYSIIPNGIYEDIIENIKNEFFATEVFRIRTEVENFKHLIKMKRDFAKYQTMNNKQPFDPRMLIILDEQELAEEQNKFLIIFKDLLNFLLGRMVKSRISYYENCWEDKFDKKINGIYFNLKVDDKDINIKDDKGNSNELKQENMVNVLNTFKNRLRGEEYYPIKNEKNTSNQYDYILKDMIKYSSYASGLECLERTLSEENPHNPRLRTLIIATFLRAIYALLEYPANKHIRNNMVKLLYKDNNLKEIGMLVDSTKMNECNIATKYLVISSKVISSSKFYFQQALSENNYIGGEKFVDKEFLNKIGVVSFLIKKMLRVTNGELKLEDNNNKQFLSEISTISLLVCNSVENIHFSDHFSKQTTLEKLINFDIIQVLIQAIKDNMNAESAVFQNEICGKGGGEEGGEEKPKEKPTAAALLEIKNTNLMMLEMMKNIATVIGVYMNKVPESYYIIMEKLTKSYIFEKVKFRKTYLKDIIHAKRFDSLEEVISDEIGKRAFYITRGHFFFMHKNKDKDLLMILTELGIEFLETSGDSNPEKDFEMQEFEHEKSFLIKYDDIEVIIVFELINRVVIKTKSNAIINCFFERVDTHTFLKAHVKFHNPSFYLYINTKLLKLPKVDDDGIEEEEKDQEKEEKEEKEKSEEEKTKKEEKKYSTDGYTELPEDDEEKKEGDGETNEDNAKKLSDSEESQEVSTFLLGSMHEANSFNYVNSIFDDPNYLPEKKLLVFKGKHLFVYKQLNSLWKQINFPKIFADKIEYSNVTAIRNGRDIGDFSSCYQNIYCIDLSKMVQVNFKGVDQIIFKFEDGGFKFFKMYDDYSYSLFKKALITSAKDKGMEIFDDPYSQIN